MAWQAWLAPYTPFPHLTQIPVSHERSVSSVMHAGQNNLNATIKSEQLQNIIIYSATVFVRFSYYEHCDLPLLYANCYNPFETEWMCSNCTIQ